MKTLKELRADLKSLGFKLAINNTGTFPTATYIHIESKQKLDFNVFTPELLARWKPLFDYQQANVDHLLALKQELRVVGLIGRR